MSTIGAICALVAALAWAGSSTILKFLTVKVDTLSLNTLRLWFVSLCLIAFIPLSGRVADFVHTPLVPLVYVMASGVVSLAIGDTIFIKSLSFLDVSRAYPIAMCSFPIFTMSLAISLLGESFTWVTGVGAFLVVPGIYMVAAAGRGSAAKSVSARISNKGVILAIMAGLSWAISAALLKKGAMGMDPFVATAIRMFSATIALSPFALTRRRREILQFVKYGSRSVALAATSGILDYGIGVVVYTMAIQFIGAGKTVLLASTSPLFILPFAVLILKEKLTRYVLAGIFICVAGIYLVAM